MRVLVALVTQGLNPDQDVLPDLVAQGARALGVVEAAAEASTVDRFAEPEIQSLEAGIGVGPTPRTTGGSARSW